MRWPMCMLPNVHSRLWQRLTKRVVICRAHQVAPDHCMAAASNDVLGARPTVLGARFVVGALLAHHLRRQVVRRAVRTDQPARMPPHKHILQAAYLWHKPSEPFDALSLACSPGGGAVGAWGVTAGCPVLWSIFEEEGVLVSARISEPCRPLSSGDMHSDPITGTVHSGRCDADWQFGAKCTQMPAVGRPRHVRRIGQAGVPCLRKMLRSALLGAVVVRSVVLCKRARHDSKRRGCGLLVWRSPRRRRVARTGAGARAATGPEWAPRLTHECIVDGQP